jgi:hypothetical protein
MSKRLFVSGVAAAVVVGAALLLSIHRAPSAGPLAAGSDTTITGIALDENQVASVGVFVPVPAGSEGVVLDRVQLVDPTSGIHLVDARVSTGRGQSFVCVGSALRFPPPDCRLFPVEGWRVSAQAMAAGGFQLVLGLKTTQTGAAWYPGVALEYHDTNGSYKEILRQGGELCAPRDRYLASGCPDRDKVAAAQSRLG